ncbi:hypothetical protein PR048_020446 [Dryococelus australis]|uniref:HAT C-terminal dimerisation domain-containing protein n=1 Tax=Dryococelus australis TaxID=614101 RepID=A0ABQ9H699_9NEOP|nr:hypothetical protein PR048_020446 [Dryococelus australis]
MKRHRINEIFKLKTMKTCGVDSASVNTTSAGVSEHLHNPNQEEIQSPILRRVKGAQFFSVIFDETTDISGICQLSILLRYLHGRVLREDLITFVSAYDTIRDKDIKSEEERRLSGVALGHIVEDIAKNFDFDLKFCVGFGVDSCSWKRIVKNKEKLPDYVLETLENCDIDMCPTIHKHLQILTTYPVSAAISERSFSTLHRLKTWLRANIGEKDLLGLLSCRSIEKFH